MNVCQGERHSAVVDSDPTTATRAAAIHAVAEGPASLGLDRAGSTECSCDVQPDCATGSRTRCRPAGIGDAIAPIGAHHPVQSAGPHGESGSATATTGRNETGRGGASSRTKIARIFEEAIGCTREAPALA